MFAALVKDIDGADGVAELEAIQSKVHAALRAELGRD